MNSKTFILTAIATFLATFARPVFADCSGFGNDIGNGGVYFFDPNSGAPFSFQGGFLPSCILETCTTAIQLTGGNQVGCSSVSTGQTDYEATCPLAHNQLVAGAYTILITCPDNGLVFGRGFTVVNTEATSTVYTTETVTGTVTPFSTFTSTTTTTETDLTTLPPVTVTVPNATSGTITLHPSTTVTSTKTFLYTQRTATTVSITTTKTKIPHCISTARKSDSTTQAPASTIARRNSPQVRRDMAVAAKHALAKRVGPDGPLTTTVTISASPVVVLVTAAATTTTVPSFTVVTTTSTINPPVQTVFSGIVPFTVTAPTVTRTINTRVQGTTTVTATRIVHFVLTVTPAPKMC